MPEETKFGSRVQTARECDCTSCTGGESKPGFYGGWHCTCSCHNKDSRSPMDIAIERVKQLQDNKTTTKPITEEEFDKALIQRSEAVKLIEAYIKQEADTIDEGDHDGLGQHNKKV